jgi:drug/metabolite transporter (DMT)-like permease
MPEPTRMRASLALLLACACWGLSFPLVRALSLSQAASVPDAGSWCLSSWCLLLRYGIATVLLAACSWTEWRGWWRQPPTAAEWWQALGLGVFTAGGALLQMDGLSYTQASTSAFLTQLYAVWIPVVVVLRTRTLPGWWTTICLAAVLLGMAILAGLDPHDLRLGRGEIETVLGSLVFTAQILWAERLGYAANRMTLVALVSFVISGACFIPAVWVTSPTLDVGLQLYADPRHVVLLGLLAAIPTGIGMWLMFRFQRFVGAVAAGIIYCTEPLFAALFAFVLPGVLSLWLGVAYANERLTTELALGATLIIAANLAMQLRPKGPPSAPEPEAQSRAKGSPDPAAISNAAHSA